MRKRANRTRKLADADRLPSPADPLDIAADFERAALADVARGVGRYDARGGHCVGGRHFHLKPRLVATAVAPDAAHFGVGVARDHFNAESPHWTQRTVVAR